MKPFIFATVISVIFSAALLFGTEYYVDPQVGNDAASGTAPQTAFKTLRAVNKADIKPGDTVRFRCGGQWRGQLLPKSGEEGKPVVYTSYGTGAKPQLLGSVPLDKPDDWLNEGDHLWATRPDEIHSGSVVPGFLNLTWGLHQEGQAKARLQITASSYGKGTAEYQIICTAPGSASNHLQFIVAGFPVKAETYYLFRFAAKTDKPFAFKSVGFCEPVSPWNSLGSASRLPGKITDEWNEYEILFHCAEDCGTARFTLYLGSILPPNTAISFVPLALTEATAESNGIDTDVGNIILDGTKAGFKKWTKADLKEQDDFWYNPENNRVYYFSYKNPALLYKNIEAALHRHVVNHSNSRYVHFTGLDVRYGGAHGFGGTKAEHCVYRDLDVSWVGGADQYREGGSGQRVRFGNGIEFWADASDNLVEHCRLWEIYDAALTNQGSGVNQERNIVYRGNQIWNCEYSFEYWNRGPESVTDNILFENNECRNAGFGWGHRQRPDKNGRHLMVYQNTAKTTNFIIRNNVFDNATESCVRFDADFRDGLAMDENIYQQDSAVPVFQWLGEKYGTERFAEYQKNTGLDKKSKVSRR